MMEIELQESMVIEYEDPVFWDGEWVGLMIESLMDGSTRVSVTPPNVGRVVRVAENHDKLSCLGAITGWDWERRGEGGDHE